MDIGRARLPPVLTDGYLKAEGHLPRLQITALGYLKLRSAHSKIKSFEGPEVLSISELSSFHIPTHDCLGLMVLRSVRRCYVTYSSYSLLYNLYCHSNLISERRTNTESISSTQPQQLLSHPFHALALPRIRLSSKDS